MIFFWVFPFAVHKKPLNKGLEIERVCFKEDNKTETHPKVFVDMSGVFKLKNPFSLLFFSRPASTFDDPSAKSSSSSSSRFLRFLWQKQQAAPTPAIRIRAAKLAKTAVRIMSRFCIINCNKNRNQQGNFRKGLFLIKSCLNRLVMKKLKLISCPCALVFFFFLKYSTGNNFLELFLEQ